MEYYLILSGIILFLSVLSSKLLYRLGIPTLIIFLTLGIVLGSEGFKIVNFENYIIAQQISSFGLIFIIFYGGFGMNWKTAKPILAPAILLSTFGVIITALLVGLFAYLVLGFTLFEGLLLGSVISSTDAASVFSILRSKNLNLKNNLAPMLEMESGSNDPMAYMLTVLFISLITADRSQSMFLLIFNQIFIGVLMGLFLGWLASLLVRKINLKIDGLYPIFVIAIVLLGFSLSNIIGGNGYLTIYILGIMMGNSVFPKKNTIVKFFDGISWLMQIIIFFTLGLLVFPSKLIPIAFVGLLISFFLFFVARPISVISILSFFKIPIKHQIFVSWVGLRGVASVVFAAYVLAANIMVANEIFNLVFFIALFSVIIQGTLMPIIAKKLDLIKSGDDVMKTFNDYIEETHNTLLEIDVKEDNPIVGKTIIELNVPLDILIIMIKRNNKIITPRGSTQIMVNDKLILTGDNKDQMISYFNKNILNEKTI